METAVQAIRPGLLIALSTTLKGGVSYARHDLDASEETAASPAAEVAKWETTRIIEDAEEHRRGVLTRAKVRNMITGVCFLTSFGLVCPDTKEAELWAVVAEARGLVDEFNRSAERTRLDLFILPGRIAKDDETAMRAIVAEAGSLVEAMEKGILSADSAAIRDAASKARALSSMLDGRAAEAVTEAIESARKAARALVKRVEKGGEKAAEVLAGMDTSAVSAGRMALLGILDETVEVAGEALPTVAARAIDLGTDTDTDTDTDTGISHFAPAVQVEL
jgi:hypothetical protein